MAIALVMFNTSCGGDINTVGDPHFNIDGTLADSLLEVTLVPSAPAKVKFYVEVSGSMNGFFRANRATDFKKDVWQIISYFSDFAPSVSILTNDGMKGAEYTQEQFQTLMNTGAFVSSASTRVPVMLQSIFDNLNTEAGEVAVLISDMKYSPVGAAAPDVLSTQYSTDISTILGTQNKAISLVGATSDYLDKSGTPLTDKSPYYYFIIGNGSQVAFMRNGISTMLQNNGHFVDNIESGFDYGVPTCSFDVPDNCYQMDEATPTFVGLDSDTCTIKMEVHLEGYRWIVASEGYFTRVLKISALNGSNVNVDDIKIEIENVTNKQLMRKATAYVAVKVYDMPMDSEVLEWSLELPDTDIAKFAPYLDGATSENDPTKSYSVQDFIKGIFYGGIVNKTLNPNYILISRNS